MNFIQKPKLQIGNSCYFSSPFQKPSTCPFCGIDTDAILNSVNQPSYKTGANLYIISLKCTHCSRSYVALYEKMKEGQNEKLCFIEVLPRPTGTELPACLSIISPRFSEVHKEAEGAETFGFTDLASIGYRKALEILVKDYAINFLHKDRIEVEKKSLATAIGTYLQQSKLVKTADVVRILGNDRTHYREKYPQHDFTILKHYYNIFISQIVVQYEIEHPPVERES